MLCWLGVYDGNGDARQEFGVFRDTVTASDDLTLGILY